MDIVTTSLEALIQRATCSQNQSPDTAAIDAFCGLVSKEPDCAQTATRFITAKVHSLQEWEALQALHVLDACMKRCGSSFHAEVGKFRFLNELIKLVSPKYNGAHTPEPVKRRVLELMQSWTIYYPREFKIKEAYEMLKKQGVVKEEMMVMEAHKSLDQNIIPPPPRHQDSIFQDTEKSRLLQKLLQSKNPDDLQAANRLIKTMVKEDERRVEMKSRQLSELEAAHNNARLLSEMLESYSQETSSAQDLELIKELQASCLRFRPNVQKLLSEVHSDERLFNEVLAANDELGEVLEKYGVVIVQGLPASAVGGNLLDLSSPATESLPPPPTTPAPASVSLLCEQLTDISIDASVVPNLDSALPIQLSSSILPPQPPQPLPSQQPLGDLASLGDIFSSLAQPAAVPMSPVRTVSEKPVAKTGLEELDAISESLLKQSLPQTVSQPVIKAQTKVPMNQLPLSHQASPVHSSPALVHSISPPSNPVSAPPPDSLDLLIDSTEDLKAPPQPQVNGDTPVVEVTAEPQPLVKSEVSIRPLGLGDITVPLETIKPGSLPPLPVLQERGVAVTIHFARDSPRDDVSVFVVTTTSQSQYPVSDYLFQAIVPKGCRLRLQPPSSTELPAHNPFLPPAAITQVMLIASPDKKPIMLRVVMSFTMDDETVTEMKEVEKFPLLNS
ncbi:ADP-ribosylation factor-binding protein GGA1-like isoform X2 [Homalodisca vitripennis]|uniref:ADP-ribosylation factor-binding protein GGA1-like isoform X2 n=1 Tax=Homalodisca vitripennis TaxID=197043 RepID=UPI001EEA3792|nr:ADP-ribosylation factor-binding protein GGA1-like isoform X2 [Homalodisca vitripennis]